MYGGDLQRVLIKFYGENPEPITDRLPTASIVEQGTDYFIIKAEVYGKGNFDVALKSREEGRATKPGKPSLGNERKY